MLYFWRGFGVSQFVLFFISQDYKISLPLSSSDAFPEKQLLVSQAVMDILSFNLVKQILLSAWHCWPAFILSSSLGPTKLFYLDLRHVNSFIFNQRFKSEDLGVAPQSFGPSFHLLKSATPYVTKYQGD